MEVFEVALDEEGLVHEREDDDQTFRLTFKSEGDRYFVVVYRNDSQFAMVGTGWAIADGVDLAHAVALANILNARKKFVKVAVWEEQRDVLFTVELPMDEGAEIGETLSRILDALRDCVGEFFAGIRTDYDEPASE
ncbi:MAG: YbjN domain-containing protein [Vulcanimicrobiaceae bacterium]